ncbi:MAG: hypothetical protein ACI4S2_03430 [Lachnospiraceae bacterium]
MKNPLHYQLSEYDCGPTAMLDAISFLFEREEISPVVIRNIMLYCLDCYNCEGIMGKSGTSSAAMMFDPYYVAESLNEKGVTQVEDHPFEYNRIVDESCFNRETEELYALGPIEGREAVIIFNESTKKTEEKTIEYFI